MVCLLDWRKGLSVEVFRKTQVLADSYWIDMQRFITPHNTVNTQGIYDMFGEYSLTNGGEIRCGFIDWINEWKDEIHDNVKIALDHKNLSFTDWLAYTAKDKNPADEIAIYCLARMYRRHVVIYMSSFCWSTLLRHLSYNKQEIHKHCDIRLILLGKLKYAHVCPIYSPTSTIPKPFPTKVKKEDIKPSIKTENKTELPKRRCSWDRNIVSKMTCRGQKLANRSLNTNICSSNIFL